MPLPLPRQQLPIPKLLPKSKIITIVAIVIADPSKAAMLNKQNNGPL